MFLEQSRSMNSARRAFEKNHFRRALHGWQLILLGIKVLGEMVSIGTLLAFTIVCLSVIILRRTRPDLGRTFRTPWQPTVPALGGVICLAQMIFLPVATWVRLAIWLIIGLIIYLSYGRRHCVLNRKRSDRSEQLDFDR
jgi:APA family basic amino acid/polyamine antiporter